MDWGMGRLGARFFAWPSCGRHGYPDWLRPAGRQQLKMLEPDDWRNDRLNAPHSFSGIGYCTGSSRPNDYHHKRVT